MKKVALLILLVFLNCTFVFAEDPPPEAKGCTQSTDPNSLCSPKFELPVGSFTPGGTSLIQDTGEDTINNVLGTIIQKAMVGIGVVSLFCMTIGAGYIIVYHGQDNLLSRGKQIFGYGILGLIVSLGSYYMVSLLRFILYKV